VSPPCLRRGGYAQAGESGLVFYCNVKVNIGDDAAESFQRTADSRRRFQDEILPIVIIELRKSNGTLSILLHPPHPPLSPDYGGEDQGEGA
jgi:hypothetical protein